MRDGLQRVSTAWVGNYYDDTHGKVIRCLTFVCDSEVMLVLCIAECLRCTVLLLDCLIARLLCLLDRLFNCINARKRSDAYRLGLVDIPSLIFFRRSRQTSVLCQFVRHVSQQP